MAARRAEPGASAARLVRCALAAAGGAAGVIWLGQALTGDPVQALHGASGLVLGAGLASMLLTLVLWLVSGARLRRQPPSTQYKPDLAAMKAQASAHRLVRIAIYAVVCAASALTAFQSWQAHRLELQRAVDAEVADLAGAQRMFSQRIGWLAASSSIARPGRASARLELGDALQRGEADAKRLGDLLALHYLPGGGETEAALGLAVTVWQHSSERLRRSAGTLLRTDGQGNPLGTTEDAAAVDGDADLALASAQRLVDAISLVARARHQRVVWLTSWLALTSLGLLALLAVAVAEPTASAVKRQYMRLVDQTLELERLALVAERTTNGVMLTGADGRIHWTNQAFTRITGFTGQQAQGQRTSDLMASPRADGGGLARLSTAMQEGVGARMSLQLRHRDGRDLWLDLDMQPVRSTTDELSGFVGVAVDITDRRQAQADLRIAAIAFDSLEAIVVSDAQQVILRVNDAFTRITGYSATEAIGQVTGRLLRSGRHDAAFYTDMWALLERDRYWQGEVWNRHKSGEIYLEGLSITAVTDDEGAVVNFVAVFTDITQKKRADETIHKLAFYDALTDLPNRRLLHDRLQQTITGCGRRGRSAALIFMDLDNFKELNDSRGHGLGDLLLVEVAKRLLASVRANDTVARQGGDEFVIVLDDLSADSQEATRQAELIAEKIRVTVGQPVPLQGGDHSCTPSLGIIVFQGAELGVDELLRRADTAMYAAKNSGRNSVRFFDPNAHEAMQARLAFEADLRRALPEQQLHLYFQPQVSQSGEVLGAEVLLRWRHPSRGQVPPSEFIPIAELSDLIVDIGRWVLETSCGQLQSWTQSPATRALQLSVNVSARQFRQADFVDQVRDVLQRSGADPARLKLELTESLVLVNIEDAASKMQAIRELGVRFSMDDFGTGQSSLAYLSQLPIDQLKIDQSFVRNLDNTRAGATLVQTIIGMANNLGLDVIAEGVETVEQRAFLERNGCLSYQGYLFGKPMPLEDFERAFLAEPSAFTGS